MKNWWIKFGCFLIGYNYGIVRNSSEVAAKAVKRYTSALMIVCILWSFLGFSFTNRYLHTSLRGSLFGAFIFVVIIIQIERQIILSLNPSKWLYLFRSILAILMSLIGAIILDQIIFKEDIDLEKITYDDVRIQKALIPRTAELRNQIANIDTAIFKKETERINLINDVSKNPTTIIYSSQTSTRIEKSTQIDINTGRPITTEKTLPVSITTRSNVANPKISLIAPLEINIDSLRAEKLRKDNELLLIRPTIAIEIKSKIGILDELKVMYILISNSKIAASFWLIWFSFLFFLELLVLISKVNEKENDYERTVKHQMDLQLKKLALFAKMAENPTEI